MSHIIIIYQAGVICFDVVKAVICPVALVLLLSLQDGNFWKDWIYRNILCSLLVVWISFAFSALFAGGFWLSDVESGGGVAAYNGYFI